MTDIVQDEGQDEEQNTATKRFAKDVARSQSIAAMFAPVETTKALHIADNMGNTHTFTIRRFASVGEYNEVGRRIRARIAALKANAQKKLKVFITSDLIAGAERLFPDAETSDSKLCIYLTTEADITVASHLEGILVEPEMTWAEAAVFCRTAGMAASRIISEFNEFNSVELQEDIKNA